MIPLFFMLSLLIQFNGGAVNGECTINLDRDVSETNLPVFTMKRNWEEDLVLQPAGKNIILSVRKLEVSCPGTHLGNLDVEKALVECDESDKMTVDGKPINLKDLRCAKPISVEFLLKSNIPSICGIGYHQYTLDLNPKVIDWPLAPIICTGRIGLKRRLKIIYSLHPIKHEYCAVKINDQEEMKPLRIEGESNGQYSFVKHWMVPAEDLISFPTAEVNKKDLGRLTMPLYASISRNNMFSVEKALRKFALKENTKINVLTLPIYREQNELSVKLKAVHNRPETHVSIPLFGAKIVEVVKLEKCVALLVFNRLEWSEEAGAICVSSCDTYSSMFDIDFSSILVLCCSVKDILEYIPANVISPGILPCSLK